MAIIGNYQLGEELGRGPLGTVYIATHIATNKQVVFRGFMKPPGAKDQAWAECIQRYTDELSVAVELSHPNIAQIYEYGHEEGVYWIASELFSAMNVAALLDRKGPMTLQDTGAIVSQIGNALDYALSKGLVHLDITPFNILRLEDNTVKVINFGLGHIRSKWGSPYVSPEQIRNETPEAHSDVFSLGVVTYEMLMGDPPWMSVEPDAIMAAVLGEDPPPPAEQPKAVQEAVMKMMAKEPSDRYDNAGIAAEAFCDASNVAPDVAIEKHEKKKGLRSYHANAGLARYDLTTSDVRSAIDDLRAKIAQRH